MQNRTAKLACNHNIQYATCLLASSLYCIGLTKSSLFFQNIITILFVIFLLFLTLTNLLITSHNQNKSHFFIFVQVVIINLTIALTAQILKTPVTFFWVQDSILTHIPEAQKYTLFLKGIQVENLGIYSGQSTHFITGLFFLLLGTNTLATTCAQLFFKIIALTFIYKSCLILWNRKTALISIQIYGFCPTVFFYTLVLYKESAVHALYSAIFYYTIKVFIEKKWSFSIPLTITLYLMLRERFYITYLSLICILFLAYNLPFKKNLISRAAVALAFVTMLYFIQEQYSFTRILNEINQQRQLHSNYSDVLNKLNYNIPYPLAFIKILFSPYFSFNKFSLFSGFSILLIWGSFLNQLIILSSLMALRQLATKTIHHLFLWIPFIIFLLLSAYISPWNGRTRDSFYPLISCYAAFFLANNHYFNRYFRFS